MQFFQSEGKTIAFMYVNRQQCGSMRSQCLTLMCHAARRIANLPVLTMKLKEEQCAEICFCVCSGMSPSVTYARILAIHGQNALSKSSIFRWYKEFHDGCTELKDKDHNPHLRKVTTAKVDRGLLTDKRQSVSYVA